MAIDVAAALAKLQGEGSFATALVADSDGLRLEVKGVGPIKFPMSATTARKLTAVTKPAPFGRRDKTLHDKKVRDTGEIPSRMIKIDESSWHTVLAERLEVIQEDLGLSGSGTLEAVLDKMLVYGPGQFFKPHKDSERADDMVASLIIELPCEHQGGNFVVRHQDETKTFRGPAPVH